MITERLMCYFTPAQMLELNDRKRAIPRLLNQRVDIYLDCDLDTRTMIRKAKVPLFRLGIVDEVPTYPFLYKKHVVRTLDRMDPGKQKVIQKAADELRGRLTV